ncbi:MAG: hypothetical protein H6824_19810 [Planctomycetaceae bacterium]|nr:hypothetical protein [Planctomycetaceae bacterium]
MILPGIADWLRRMGFVSYNKVELLSGNTSPEFSSFGWDLVGPSYLSGLATFRDGKPKPGFFVADICLVGELNKADVEYFVQKCQVVRKLRNSRPFHAMLLGEFFEKDALLLGRSEGLIFATLDDFFGKGTLEATRTLMKALTRAAEVASANPDALATILETLGKIEGASLNIRGALFELIAAHAVKTCEGGSIDIGRKVTDREGNSAEIDVLHWKSKQSVLAIECKGIHPSNEVTLDEVKDWVTRQIPVIRRHCQSQHELVCARNRFEFWTSGRFENHALAYLTDVSTKTKKYEIGWKDGTDVGKYITQIRSARLRNVYREHYENKLQ